MKILHLFSDWKWTGPAEPIVNLCQEMERRGHEVTLAYRKPPLPVEDSIERRVFERGVRATDRFRLSRPLKLYSLSSMKANFNDIFDLSDFFRKERIDILTVHQSHDHLLGGIAARRSNANVLVIRMDHKRDFLMPSIGNRFLMHCYTDGIITFSEKAKLANIKHFGLPSERVERVPPALDLDRYQPSGPFKDMRAVFGLKRDEVILGVIARFQKYRRTDVLLQALPLIVKEFPRIKLLLVGRSSQMNESIIQPMKRLRVEPWVILGGYRTEDYLDTLACMDIFVFLMAGSDGSARALREAMAMGKPAIVANRGILPELIEDGVSGLVVEDTPERLAQAVLKLLRNPEKRSTLGKAAYEKAHREFRLERQAEEIERFYEKMIRLGRWKRR